MALTVSWMTVLLVYNSIIFSYARIYSYFSSRNLIDCTIIHTNEHGSAHIYRKQSACVARFLETIPNRTVEVTR